MSNNVFSLPKSSRGTTPKLMYNLYVLTIVRFMRNHKKTAFIVEHDLILATYLADRVVLFNGTPSVQTKATA